MFAFYRLYVMGLRPFLEVLKCCILIKMFVLNEEYEDLLPRQSSNTRYNLANFT